MFGDMIQYLSIDFRGINADESNEIIKIINEKSFKSLKTLKLENCKRDIMTELKKSFDNVNSLTFSIIEGESYEKDIKLGQFFPSVVDLTLSSMKLDGWSFIDGRFSSLTKLIIDDNMENVKQSTENIFIENFFKNNSQINNVKVFDPSSNFMDHVKHLKNIEILVIEAKTASKWRKQSSEIYINNVKNVFIKISDDSQMLSYIIFDNLERLNLMAYVTTIGNHLWMEFIQSQLSVNLIHFDFSVAILSEREFSKISEKWPNLITAKIECGQQRKTDEIIEFIRKKKQLKCLEVIPEMNLNDLKDKLGDEWNIESESGSTMLVKKYEKTNNFHLV